MEMSNNLSTLGEMLLAEPESEPESGKESCDPRENDKPENNTTIYDTNALLKKFEDKHDEISRQYKRKK